MAHRIITISREFGSGGRTIGRLTAEKLGIPCYDNELLEKIAEESGLAKEYIAERGEYTPRGGWLATAFADRSVNGLSVQDYLWTVQRRLILQIGEQEDCVIVGRCADYILQGKADLLKVFIYAPMAAREERIVKLYGETSDTPEKRLRDKDRRRAAYYQFYTDMEWGKVQHYHIALDSARFGIDRCVDIIASLY